MSWFNRRVNLGRNESIRSRRRVNIGDVPSNLTEAFKFSMQHGHPTQIIVKWDEEIDAILKGGGGDER